MSYQELDARLTGRCKLSRKVGNNTYAERRGSRSIAIRLHATDILTFHKSGEIEVNTGGWHTVTTVSRINEFLPQPWRVNRYRNLTVLYKMEPSACTPVCTVDNSATISSRGKVTGGSAKEYFEQIRKADNEVKRVRSRNRHWLRKAQIGEPARNLSIQRIKGEPNVSVRMAMVKVYGLERFLLDAQAETIDNVGDEYALLDLEFDTWNRIRALRMTCPSTQAIYISPVAPECHDVETALDWMYQTEGYLNRVSQAT